MCMGLYHGGPSVTPARWLLDSSWAILEEQITILWETKCHEKDRRDRRPLPPGPLEPLDISFARSRTVTASKLQNLEKVPNSRLEASEKTVDAAPRGAGCSNLEGLQSDLVQV